METEYNFLTIDDTTKICDDIYIRPDITIEMNKKIKKNYWDRNEIRDLIKNYTIAIQLDDDFSGYEKTRSVLYNEINNYYKKKQGDSKVPTFPIISTPAIKKKTPAKPDSTKKSKKKTPAKPSASETTKPCSGKGDACKKLKKFKDPKCEDQEGCKWVTNTGCVPSTTIIEKGNIGKPVGKSGVSKTKVCGGNKNGTKQGDHKCEDEEGCKWVINTGCISTKGLFKWKNNSCFMDSVLINLIYYAMIIEKTHPDNPLLNIFLQKHSSLLEISLNTEFASELKLIKKLFTDIKKGTKSSLLHDNNESGSMGYKCKLCDVDAIFANYKKKPKSKKKSESKETHEPSSAGHDAIEFFNDFLGVVIKFGIKLNPGNDWTQQTSIKRTYKGEDDSGIPLKSIYDFIHNDEYKIGDKLSQIKDLYFNNNIFNTDLAESLPIVDDIKIQFQKISLDIITKSTMGNVINAKFPGCELDLNTEGIIKADLNKLYSDCEDESLNTESVKKLIAPYHSGEFQLRREFDYKPTEPHPKLILNEYNLDSKTQDIFFNIPRNTPHNPHEIIPDNYIKIRPTDYYTSSDCTIKYADLQYYKLFSLIMIIPNETGTAHYVSIICINNKFYLYDDMDTELFEIGTWDKLLIYKYKSNTNVSQKNTILLHYMKIDKKKLTIINNDFDTGGVVKFKGPDNITYVDDSKSKIIKVSDEP